MKKIIKYIRETHFEIKLWGISSIFPYRVKEKYWKIHDFFFPKQNWLIKNAIGKEWKDKPELISDMLFECIINYVEDECEEDVRYHIYYKTSNEEDYIKEICKIYYYAKYIRERLDNKTCHKNYITGSFYDNLYQKYDHAYCKKIIDVKEYLWT